MTRLDRLALNAALRLHRGAHLLQCLFQPGYNKGTTWNPAGGVQTSIAITDWDWGEKIDKIDITNTSTLGVQALLASILRGTGKVSAFFDSGQLPWAAPLVIKAGSNGVITFVCGSPNTPWSIPAMVTELHNRSEVAGGVKYDFTVELNCLAGVAQAFLTYTYPT